MGTVPPSAPGAVKVPETVVLVCSQTLRGVAVSVILVVAGVTVLALAEVREVVVCFLVVVVDVDGEITGDVAMAVELEIAQITATATPTKKNLTNRSLDTTHTS